MKVPVDYDVPAERIADLVIGAFEHNDCVVSWCGHAHLKGPLLDEKLESPWYADPSIYKHGSGLRIEVRVLDDKVGVVRMVTLDDIRKGLAKMAVEAPRHWGDFISENDDAHTSDLFWQFVVLGEEVYG